MAEIRGIPQVVIAVQQHVADLQQRLVEAMDAVCKALEGWAKVEHKYRDRSGDLSGSIRGYVDTVTPHMIVGMLSAGMPYAVFLELARNGEWAFLEPVVRNHMRDIEAIIEGVLRTP